MARTTENVEWTKAVIARRKVADLHWQRCLLETAIVEAEKAEYEAVRIWVNSLRSLPDIDPT